jgi:hypothetical protein
MVILPNLDGVDFDTVNFLKTSPLCTSQLLKAVI